MKTKFTTEEIIDCSAIFAADLLIASRELLKLSSALVNHRERLVGNKKINIFLSDSKKHLVNVEKVAIDFWKKQEYSFKEALARNEQWLKDNPPKKSRSKK